MTQRKFYEDEENVTPVPGTVIAASPSEIESLGPNKLINGSSVRSPSYIESQITSVRNSINSIFTTTTNKIDDLTYKYHKKEQHFSTTLANLHSNDEELLPASVYILIAGLSGTILTRRSNILLRGIVPIVLSIGTFNLTLPKTYNNTLGFLHKVEHENLPSFATKQDDLVKHTELLINKTESKTLLAQKQTESYLESLKTKFKYWSGLRIDEDVTKK